MFFIGTALIGDYLVIVNPEVTFSSYSIEVFEQEYYNILLFKKGRVSSGYYLTYVNLIKSELRILFNVDERNNPTDLSDRQQYNAYMERKDMPQPMWKLSKENVGRVLTWCVEQTKSPTC
jgi:hypothetical protein